MQEEEQDIHTRADLYAIATMPDPSYFVVPDDDPFPTPMSDRLEARPHLSPAKKKRRRNYGNTVCYVHFHNTEDVYDNTKLLPLGNSNVIL